MWVGLLEKLVWVFLQSSFFLSMDAMQGVEQPFLQDDIYESLAKMAVEEVRKNPGLSLF